MNARSLAGVGLGFRQHFAEELVNTQQSSAQFIEIAPENYLGTGGKRARLLAMAAERWPVVCHGLCGDLAGSAPFDKQHFQSLKAFLNQMNAVWYSDHLCFTMLNGNPIHDLLPMPFSEHYLKRTAQRIKQVSDFLEMPVAIENVSSYMRMPESTMNELDFISAVLDNANCNLLLDVNNVYVNSINFNFDAKQFVDALPLHRVNQIHIAGHHKRHENLLIDTHGSPIIDPVYDLLAYTLTKMPHMPPILLERDNDFPELREIDDELVCIKRIAEANYHARI